MKTDNIRIKIRGSEYIWVKNKFENERNSSIHDMHLNACVYINYCFIIAKAMPSIKNKQLHDARNFVKSTRLLVNSIKERGDA